MPIYKSIVKAQEFAKGTPIRMATDQAYRETQRLLAIASTSALAPMLLIMFALKTIDLSKVDESRIDENKWTEEVDRTGVDEPGVTDKTVKTEK